MSYEGYAQVICANGNYYCKDAFSEQEVCACGAGEVWYNAVDDTNCEAWGIIVDMTLFIEKPEQLCTCNSCGNVHKVSEALYRIPTEAETKAARSYWNEDVREYKPIALRPA